MWILTSQTLNIMIFITLKLQQSENLCAVMYNTSVEKQAYYDRILLLILWYVMDLAIPYN